MTFEQEWAYQYDENFIYDCPVEIQYIEDEDGNMTRIVPENATEISPGDLVQAKWTGTEWIENASAEYIESLEATDSADESDGTKALKAVADILETVVRGDAG
ncbi:MULTISPECIES: hypothetical protein [Bacillus]|uniref:Uncharacterized protein n=2 Tax=Bacillus mojavensis subgroup TaxID=653388 RepID=A0AAP3CQW6_BACMO|nr:MULTISPECIES: hypothetical protein [Bacillus]MCC2929071.1 hypothetical protein [Bacillus sp. LBG-1-113]MCY8509727.1 hypothetical protein [Bacillus mojavensis]MEC1755699.1 hypothetical protein [Bacillus mojavensis]MEC5230018.1 hypothetical protein [Bacillus inaquosorum]MED1194953.1 hypothetical protein [Bacillus inaquosorum]